MHEEHAESAVGLSGAVSSRQTLPKRQGGKKSWCDCRRLSQEQGDCMCKGRGREPPRQDTGKDRPGLLRASALAWGARREGALTSAGVLRQPAASRTLKSSRAMTPSNSCYMRVDSTILEPDGLGLASRFHRLVAVCLCARHVSPPHLGSANNKMGGENCTHPGDLLGKAQSLKALETVPGTTASTKQVSLL